MSPHARMNDPMTRTGATPSRIRDGSGFALIEVIVTALLVGLASMLLVGLIAAGHTSGDQRNRSQADEIAQQDQERLRGMSLEQIAGLPTTRTVVLDGETFTVTSTGTFLSSASNSSTCSAGGSGSADYLSAESKVTWQGNLRTPVIEQSVITPPAGGSLLARAVDQSGNPLSGVRIVATPSSTTGNGTSAGTTDANGCTIFSALAVGDYTVTGTRAGYVDKNGLSTVTGNATTTAGNTATTNFTLGQAGTINATFKTTISGVTYTSQPEPSISYDNPQMATFGNAAPATVPAASITTPQTLFPFYTTNPTTYTNNYSVWPGKCSVNQPTTNLATATVPPGGAGSASVLLPGVILKVSYKNSTTTALTSPDHITIYNGCTSTFSSLEQFSAAVRGVGSAGSTDPKGALGALSFPGLPYGPDYALCVDDQGYRAFGGIFTNTNFTTPTTWNVTIDSTNSGNRGVC